MGRLGLSELQHIFSDKRVHILVGKILSSHLAQDNSCLKVRVSTFPDELELIARMTWDFVGDGGGLFSFPQRDDMVLLGFVEGDEDQVYVLKRLSSKEDVIPKEAEDGSAVLKSVPGKDLNLLSDKKINIGKTGQSSTSPLVLGDVLNDLLSSLYDAILNAPQIGIGPMGPVVLDPGLRVQLTIQKQQYIDTAATNILSQLSFTERGGV
jgi:hypothetical protein